jgi:hypothetical protein
MRAGPSRVNDALGDALVVEVGNLDRRADPQLSRVNAKKSPKSVSSYLSDDGCDQPSCVENGERVSPMNGVVLETILALRETICPFCYVMA